MKLKLDYPVKGMVVQGFGQNGTPLYQQGGLAGHPGIDIVSQYNDPISDGIVGFNKKYIYSILNKDNPDPMKYRSVYVIVEADDGVYEVSYGHCNSITCQPGPITGPLGTEGNTGDVFVYGVEVTREAKLAGSHAGFHVHFQVRRLEKVRQATLHSLVTGDGKDFIDNDGFHFDVPNFNNGYNGCIDPMQFIGPQTNYQFTRDLSLYSFGYDVFQLQKRLVRLGYGSFSPTGFFGPMTRAAVTAYQVDNGIDPVGRCGPITRQSLNS